MKLEKGLKLPDFTYRTAYAEHKSYLEDIKGKKAVLYFLRYYGCRVCQYDLFMIKKSYKKFQEKNIDIKAVLQSDYALGKEKYEELQLPFEVILDPDMKLYEKFEIKPAASKEDLVGGNAMEKVKKVLAAGYEHGEYEGEELQLPAVFLINEKGVVDFAQYAENLGELIMPEEILELV